MLDGELVVFPDVTGCFAVLLLVMVERKGPDPCDRKGIESSIVVVYCGLREMMVVLREAKMGIEI